MREIRREKESERDRDREKKEILCAERKIIDNNLFTFCRVDTSSIFLPKSYHSAYIMNRSLLDWIYPLIGLNLYNILKQQCFKKGKDIKI